jgi:uncharacterized protein
MNAQFLHGAEVLETVTGSRPVTAQSPSIIGIVGTAGKGPVNQPVLIAGNRIEAVEAFGQYGADGFSLPKNIDLILDQVGAVIVGINVCDPSVHNTAVTDEDIVFNTSNIAKTSFPYISAISTSTTIKALLKFKVNDTITLPTGITAITSVKSADGVTTYADPTDYTVSGSVITRVDGQAIEAGQEVLVEYTATLASETDYTVNADTGEFTRVSNGLIVAKSTINVDYTYVDPTQVTNTDIIGGVNGTTGNYEGIEALLSASSVVGVKPKILIAPGFTGNKPDADTADPVTTALLPVAEKLKAVVYADGPNTTDEEAKAFEDDFDNRRLMILDPWVKTLNPESGLIEDSPFSSVQAGLTARVDLTLGFWTSPSNKVINGIVGVGRPIEFSMGDPNTRANLLNADNITTIIREGGGFRSWGNRTTSSDAQYQFLNIVRIADQIADGILSSTLWAIDRGITSNFVEEVLDSVNGYLRQLRTLGAIVDGRAWVDTAINTAETLANGQLYIDYDFAGTPPAERLTFRQSINNDYLTQIFDNTN